MLGQCFRFQFNRLPSLEKKFTRLSDRLLNTQEQRAVLSVIDQIDRDGPPRLIFIIDPKPSTRTGHIDNQAAVCHILASAKQSLSLPFNQLNEGAHEMKQWNASGIIFILFIMFSGRLLIAQEQREILAIIDRIERDGPLPLFSILSRQPFDLGNGI